MVLVAFRTALRVCRNSPTFAGTRSTSTPRPWSAGSRRARLRPIRSVATSCGRCAGCSGEQDPILAPFVFTSERGSTLHHRRLRAWERAGSSLARICCGTPVASPWPHKGHDTRALQAYLGHRNELHIRCLRPSWPRRGSRTSGGDHGRTSTCLVRSRWVNAVPDSQRLWLVGGRSTPGAFHYRTCGKLLVRSPRWRARAAPATPRTGTARRACGCPCCGRGSGGRRSRRRSRSCGRTGTP